MNLSNVFEKDDLLMCSTLSPNLTACERMDWAGCQRIMLSLGDPWSDLSRRGNWRSPALQDLIMFMTMFVTHLAFPKTV